MTKSEEKQNILEVLFSNRKKDFIQISSFFSILTPFTLPLSRNIISALLQLKFTHRQMQSLIGYRKSLITQIGAFCQRKFEISSKKEELLRSGQNLLLILITCLSR